MDHAFRFTAEKIRKRIALVAEHRFRETRPLDPFRLQQAADAATPPDLFGSTHGWQSVPPGSYWAGADTHFTLRSGFEIPEGWASPALHLPFGSLGDIFNHPEALVYVDGGIIGSADRHHHVISIGDLRPGRHEIALHGWTGLAGWPPSADAPDRLLMRACHVAEQNPELETFLTLAACALEAAELLDRNDPIHNALLDALDQAFLTLDTRDPLGPDLHASAPETLAVLEAVLADAGAPLDITLTGIGHAHMDIAYLWPVGESRQKNARTYSNVLRLMERHAGYRFTHSQPQLYAYFKEDYPGLYTQIRTRIAEGRWEPIGGMWVEPDTNMPGAEALVRQILLGRRWFRDEFGEAETPILWLPDTFGFTWCLPQLMKLSGLEMLVTNKLNWNQHNPMPSSTTWWEGMDGSRVLLHVLTTPRDVQHLPFPTSYKSDLSGREIKGTATNATQPAISNLLICYGYGDGGGGPTEELIARAKAFENMPSMPRMRMGRASDVLEDVKSAAADLPIWSDELYMEGHRGVLTSQAWIKRANRLAEAALHRAELLAVLTGAARQTPEMTVAWQLLCLNQFHDTLSGTAIGRVFEDARKDYARIADICTASETQALATLSGPVGVLNPSPLPRHSLGLINELPESMISQRVEDGHLVDLPPLGGYAAAPLTSGQGPFQVSIEARGNTFVLENTFVRAEIGPDGTLASVFDKSANRDLLAEGQRGNQLWAFEDRPISWDAWDIDPFFEDRAEEITALKGAAILETGPLRVALRLERGYGQSRIIQDIRLTDRSPRLEFATKIDWHERHVLLKAAFPLSVEAPTATYDIQWGQIDRPTTRGNRRDASRFEVCGHKWAAVHEGDFAVAILNDCKYGHDTHGSTMRLTLIKSSTMPDPGADQGIHEFTYALLPQSGPGFEMIRAEAEALNHPLLIAPGIGNLPKLVETSAGNVVIETLKPSEDGLGYILRLYEAEGRDTSTRLTFAHNLGDVTETNLLEDPIRSVPTIGNCIDLSLRPHQILTLLIQPRATT